MKTNPDVIKINKEILEKLSEQLAKRDLTENSVVSFHEGSEDVYPFAMILKSSIRLTTMLYVEDTWISVMNVKSGIKKSTTVKKLKDLVNNLEGDDINIIYHDDMEVYPFPVAVVSKYYNKTFYSTTYMYIGDNWIELHVYKTENDMVEN